jgi:CRISP-associated protein Cas1
LWTQLVELKIRGSVMLDRVVEIGGKGRYLSQYRGFLVVADSDKEIGRVAISDIGVLIVNAYGVTYSHSLLLTLAENNIPTVLCDVNHMPVAWVWPAETNHIQAQRMDAQLNAKAPMKKRLWQQIIKKKIVFQAELLEHLGKESVSLQRLAPKVLSGDPQNIEAQAARRYWRLLLGESFRRDRKSGQLNAQLNYGYTILRSAVARSILAAGLHPTPALNHANKYNAYRLADDLMEVFRVVVDWKVYSNGQKGELELTDQVKKGLVNSLYHPIAYRSDVKSLVHASSRLATSLVHVYSMQRDKLLLPEKIDYTSALVNQNAERIPVDVGIIDVRLASENEAGT